MSLWDIITVKDIDRNNLKLTNQNEFDLKSDNENHCNQWTKENKRIRPTERTRGRVTVILILTAECIPSVRNSTKRESWISRNTHVAAIFKVARICLLIPEIAKILRFPTQIFLQVWNFLNAEIISKIGRDTIRFAQRTQDLYVRKLAVTLHRDYYMVSGTHFCSGQISFLSGFTNDA